MPGLWNETLQRCQDKVQLAREMRERGGDLDKVLTLLREAREEAEVVRTWASMTRLLMEAQRAAKEIP